jgi:hypothetical protein
MNPADAISDKPRPTKMNPGPAMNDASVSAEATSPQRMPATAFVT